MVLQTNKNIKEKMPMNQDYSISVKTKCRNYSNNHYQSTTKN